MHGRGVCVVGCVCVTEGMHGRVHVWQAGMCGKAACVAGGMHSRGHAWHGGVRGRGVCMVGGMVGETATVAGGTHPTGMHYCLIFNSDLRCRHGFVYFFFQVVQFLVHFIQVRMDSR